MRLLYFALTAFVLYCQLAIVRCKVSRVFLQKQLPLRLVVTTPEELAGNSGTTMVYGRQALTAVFSRPVIALGSDFGQPRAQQKLPFSLSCPMPGKFRWVTTSIARFDPDVDWPTDLDCNLNWATALTTYDGAQLVLYDTAPQRSLSSYPLQMSISAITSELALNLTDGLWSSNSEVPPDGKIIIAFNYPVNLQLLKSTLKMFEASQPSGAGVPFDVSPCQSAASWIYSNGLGTSSSSSGLSLNVNTTCAEITPKGALKAATPYLIMLPRGARYHALAGPLQTELNLTVTGLEPFRVPFAEFYSQDIDSGTRYRRLDMWLPHGLSPDTTPQAFAARISLCRVSGGACLPVPFNFSLVFRARARISIPSLAIRSQYRISVAADPLVKDGFGQGLVASTLTFWTNDVFYSFNPPGINNALAVLEAGVDTLTAWPFITRGLGPRPYYGDVVSFVNAWELNLADDTVKAMVVKALLQAGFMNGDLKKWFGSPTSTLTVPPELRSTAQNASDWTQLQMQLRDTSGAPSRARLVAYVGNQSSGRSLYAKLLLNTSLSFNVVQRGQNLTAWVTDAALGGGPVVGATVTVFSNPGPWMQAEILGKCVTDSAGLCTITHSMDAGVELTAFAVSSNNRFAMLESAGITDVPFLPSDFVGSLVADRLVVVPGDSLKITGFVQQTTLNGLQLPPASYAALHISPNWEATAATAATAPTGSFGRDLLSSSWSTAATTTATTTTSFSAASSAASSTSYGSVVVSADDPSLGAAVSGVRRRASVMAVMPDVSTPGQQAFASVLVKINSTTGTFHAELPVPLKAKMQMYTVQLAVPTPGTPGTDLSGPAPSAEDSFNWQYVSNAILKITVADPRPPTVDLKLSAPAWSLPTSSVSFTATAVSYIGASVSDAALTATWRTAKASGLLRLTTDTDGLASGVIDLGAVPPANRSEAYDTLTIDVEWIGPTRERITRSASVTLADGPARLQLQLSLTPSTPGTSFAVAATLTSNTDGAALTGVPVTATLRPAPNDTLTCGNATSSCSISSGAPFSPACQLTLPCVGQFLLEACADVTVGTQQLSQQQRVCSRQVLGRSISDWKDRPLGTHPSPRLFTDKTSYVIGDNVKLQLQNPWPGARLLLQWGNQFRSRTKVVQSLNSGLVEVIIGPLADEAIGGASVVAVLDVPRLSAGQLPPLPPADQLVISNLFDPRAPHSHVLQSELDVRPDNTLAVSVAVASGDGGEDSGDAIIIQDVDGSEVVAVEPGSHAQITVNVKNGLDANASSPAAGTVEVTVYGVDKAFLDLLPYDLPHPQQQMVLQLAADINVNGMSAYRLAPGAVRAVFDKLMARLTGLDPWLPVDTNVQYNAWGTPSVDVNDTAYVSQFTSTITAVPYGWYTPNKVPDPGSELPVISPIVVSITQPSLGLSGDGKNRDSAERAGDSSGTGSSNSGNGNSGAPVRYETDFVVTPLFATAVTDGTGAVRVTFTAPPNLGTFVIRAFAAAGSSAKYGSGEAKVAVRRRLSLTPSIPRFARVGDVFQSGVIVTVGSVPATVNVQLQVDGGALSATGPLRQTVIFTSEEDLQQEVRFNFSAVAIGRVNLSFAAEDAQPGGGADALQLELSVAGQQGDVWVATSFALTALPPSSNASSSSGGGGVVQWQEGMELPAAVQGSGGLNLTAGVGYFPAIGAVYDNLEKTDTDRSFASAVPGMLWATLPAILFTYGQTIVDRQSELVAAAFADLTTLTDSSWGLLWTEPGRWYGWTPSRTDLYLNTWALFLFAQHGPALRSSPSAASWASLESNQVMTWRTAVASQVVADAVQSRLQPYAPGPYSDWYTLAWVRLVLGADWFPADASAQIRQDLSLESLVAAKNAMGRQTRVLTSLVLQTMGSKNPSPELVSSTTSEITSALRVQGRTAYVASGPGSSFAAPVEDQALALLLLLRAGVNHQLLPKLAAYIANPPPSGGFGIWYSGYSWRDQALAVAALTEYDSTRGSSKPNVDLLADVNGLTVLQATFKAAGNTQPVTNFTAWEDIPSPSAGALSELNFEVTGSGEVTVAASLHFVPAELLPYPSYRGLFVEAVLQMVDPTTGGPTGQPISAVPLGSVVALTVQVTSPDDLGPVTLSVMMPAGLEPLDPNLPGNGGGVDLSCGANWVTNWGSFYRWWWWPMCPSQETRPSLVTFSYMALRAGTSSVSLRAVAATPGSFVFPPVRAAADNQPELMGMTGASKLQVCTECYSPSFARLPPVPRACPNDCSGKGMCNPQTGRCKCDPGFTRADCSRSIA
ncbi:hypothetical protein Vretimale_13856 [Volvox reticuliferus]|uniref:EGF-like domain-containing protein n=2 Tax=Volvox reticuliferus TaxID=1737510 RepID=A0A8J4CME5_9CHLO|nr:hypothetical protein Vretifemale_14532 [Volvox reticuliferus]GIM10065.1 hypothetical protein Vretimale_13856 [Volvox reticuliferus]